MFDHPEFDIHPIVTFYGHRKDGTVLFVHTCTGPDQPVYISVIRNGNWKESQAYYYEEDAMEAVNKAWPDVEWKQIKNIDFVKYVITNDNRVHEDDYVADVIANHFGNVFDLEEADDSLVFQMDGKFYSIQFGNVHMDEQMADMYDMPEKYGYWQFYDENEKELVKLRWAH